MADVFLDRRDLRDHHSHSCRADRFSTTPYTVCVVHGHPPRRCTLSTCGTRHYKRPASCRHSPSPKPPMTIATSLQEKKLQDCVESDTIRVISGTTARRAVYSIYICVIATTAGILYLFPSTVIITGFIVLQVLLFASLYPLVKFAMMTEDHDLVWDQDGLHWLQQTDVVQVNEYCDQPYRNMSPPANFHMSYAFI